MTSVDRIAPSLVPSRSLDVLSVDCYEGRLTQLVREAPRQPWIGDHDEPLSLLWHAPWPGTPPSRFVTSSVAAAPCETAVPATASRGRMATKTGATSTVLPLVKHSRQTETCLSSAGQRRDVVVVIDSDEEMPDNDEVKVDDQAVGNLSSSPHRSGDATTPLGKKRDRCTKTTPRRAARSDVICVLSQTPASMKGSLGSVTPSPQSSQGTQRTMETFLHREA